MGSIVFKFLNDIYLIISSQIIIPFRKSYDRIEI